VVSYKVKVLLESFVQAPVHYCHNSCHYCFTISYRDGSRLYFYLARFNLLAKLIASSFTQDILGIRIQWKLEWTRS
jgi:hypothetical protein